MTRLLNTTSLLFAYVNDHSLTVVAQKSAPSRDRKGADAQLLLTLCLAAVCLLTAGCGYHVSGHADLMPKTIETIAIPAFGNATVQYKLTDRLPEAIAREFISRTRYKVVNDMNQADAILRGTVINFNSYPIIFDPSSGRASTIQVSVVMSIQLTERTTGKVLFARPSLEWKQQYEISVDPRAFIDESDSAMQRLSRDVARTVVSGILENF